MEIAILNATIFDGTGRDPYGPAAVVIEDERNHEGRPDGSGG